MEGLRLDDADLIERAQRGDAGVYEELVRRYQDVAFRTAYIITREAPAAEDVVQDAFVKAYYALPGFRRGWSFRPWLLRIVTNEAKNRQMSEGRRARLKGYLARSAQDAVAPSPEAAVVTGERREDLLRAIDQLSSMDQLVILYRYFLDFSEAEMAQVLNCPRGTIKSRLSRALGRLREEIAETEIDILDAGAPCE